MPCWPTISGASSARAARDASAPAGEGDREDQEARKRTNSHRCAPRMKGLRRLSGSVSSTAVAACRLSSAVDDVFACRERRAPGLLGVSRPGAHRHKSLRPGHVDRTAADKVTVRTVRSRSRSSRRPAGRGDLRGRRVDQRLHPAGAGRRGAGDREDRSLDPLRRRQLYIAARRWDSHPEREVANELRRDNGNILGNENFTFVIDPLHDRRNGYLFQTNRSARCAT